MNREQHEKYLPAIAENTDCLIVKMCDSFIDLKVSVLLDHGVSLCFVSLLRSSSNMLENVSSMLGNIPSKT